MSLPMSFPLRAAILGLVLTLTTAQVWIEDPFQAKLGLDEEAVEHGLFLEEELEHGMFMEEEIGHGVNNGLMDKEEYEFMEEIGHGINLDKDEEEDYAIVHKRNVEENEDRSGGFAIGKDEEDAELAPALQDNVDLTLEHFAKHDKKREAGHEGHAGHGIFMGLGEEVVDAGHGGHIDKLVEELEEEMEEEMIHELGHDGHEHKKRDVGHDQQIHLHDSETHEDSMKKKRSSDDGEREKFRRSKPARF